MVILFYFSYISNTASGVDFGILFNGKIKVQSSDVAGKQDSEYHQEQKNSSQCKFLLTRGSRYVITNN